MRQGKRGRYFDLSGTLILGLVVALFVSMPGGCGDDGETGEEADATETSAEPTSPPTMEIVEPEPGENQPVTSEDEEEAGPEGDDPASDPDPESAEEEQDGEQAAEDQPEEEPAAQDGTYVVQEGDTLFDIAVQLDVSVDDLIAENDIENPGSLQVGQVLRIPE